MSKPKESWWGFARIALRRYNQEPWNDRARRDRAAITAAIEETKKLPDGELRLKLLDMVYIRQTHKVIGAAQHMHVSEGTAKRKLSQFFYLWAKHRGI